MSHGCERWVLLRRPPNGIGFEDLQKADANSHFSPAIRPVLRVDDLRPPDNRHGPIVQKGADECAIYLQAAVVVDEAFLLERIHKFAYPCAGGTNHLREGSLAHLQGALRF